MLDETASALAESEDGYLSEQTRREAVATYDDDPAAARNPGMPQVAFVSLADGVFTVRGSLRLDISPDAIYELLTDYASCQRVFKNIASSEVIHTEAGLEVIQVGLDGVEALAGLDPHVSCCSCARITPVNCITICLRTVLRWAAMGGLMPAYTWRF